MVGEGLKSTSRLQPAGSGTIDVKEMHSALHSMGHNPTDEELFAIIHEVGLLRRDTASNRGTACETQVVHTCFSLGLAHKQRS